MLSSDPILLIGGSSNIGRQTARILRTAHPDVPLLIGGRGLAKAISVLGNLRRLAVSNYTSGPETFGSVLCSSNSMSGLSVTSRQP